MNFSSVMTDRYSEARAILHAPSPMQSIVEHVARSDKTRHRLVTKHVGLIVNLSLQKTLIFPSVLLPPRLRARLWRSFVRVTQPSTRELCHQQAVPLCPSPDGSLQQSGDELLPSPLQMKDGTPCAAPERRCRSRNRGSSSLRQHPDVGVWVATLMISTPNRRQGGAAWDQLCGVQSIFLLLVEKILSFSSCEAPPCTREEYLINERCLDLSRFRSWVDEAKERGLLLSGDRFTQTQRKHVAFIEDN